MSEVYLGVYKGRLGTEDGYRDSLTEHVCLTVGIRGKISGLVDYVPTDIEEADTAEVEEFIEDSTKRAADLGLPFEVDKEILEWLEGRKKEAEDESEGE